MTRFAVWGAAMLSSGKDTVAASFVTVWTEVLFIPSCPEIRLIDVLPSASRTAVWTSSAESVVVTD